MTGTSRSTPRRELLIALNRRLDLPRDVVVRLALTVDQWAGDMQSGDPRAGDSQPGGQQTGRADPEPSILPELPIESLGRRLRPVHLEEARRLAEAPGPLALDEIERAARAGAQVVTLADPDYPMALRDLDLPPPVLYVRGRLPHSPAVSMVGSRRADDYAIQAATAFARSLAESGLTIVSGLARGVDAASHRGALDATRGRTVAVQACGIDRIYPRRHGRLADRIAERGALVTEFPIGAAPLARNFPVRNRIIAALAVGTLIVQGARRSGTMVTARLAAELGREVWAIPGSIYRSRATGANELIRDGASIVLEPRDVIESLPLAVRDRLPAYEASGSAARPLTGALAEALSTLVERTAMSPEALASELGRSIAETLVLLAELELRGQVRRCPGPLFRVVEPP